MNPSNTGSDTVEIPLTQGLVALVDSADYAEVAQIKWHAIWKPHGKRFYAGGYPHGGNKSVRLHNYLLRPPAGMYVDHINRNPLDNRRCNLRCHTLNCHNRGMRVDNKTGVIGVYRARNGRWTAMIQRFNKRKHLGIFFTFEAAKAARELAEQAAA